jgi:predicted component of type VI protein secretion system
MVIEHKATYYAGLAILSRYRCFNRKFRIAGYSQFCQFLQKCIRTFEPRIGHPHVFLTRSDTLNRSIKFYIEGSLTYENMEEEIKFDTVLELISGEYEVR